MSAYLDDFSGMPDEDWAFQDEDLLDETIESFMQNKEKYDVARPVGRGRPRKHFTKKVTMVEVEASGWLVRASRGRPKKGEMRVEVEVPFDLEIASKRFYTHETGVLIEVWTSHEQR